MCRKKSVFNVRAIHTSFDGVRSKSCSLRWRSVGRKLECAVKSRSGRYGEHTFFIIESKCGNENFERYEWEWMTKVIEIPKGLLDVYCPGVIVTVGFVRFAHPP